MVPFRPFGFFHVLFGGGPCDGLYLGLIMSN